MAPLPPTGQQVVSEDKKRGHSINDGAATTRLTVELEVTMSIKTTGLELKSFYADPDAWSSHDGKPLYWVDDIGLAINGAVADEDPKIQALQDSDEVQILSGFVYSYENLSEVATLEEYFNIWQRSLGSVFLGAFVPPGQYENIRAAIEAAGGQVLRRATST